MMLLKAPNYLQPLKISLERKHFPSSQVSLPPPTKMEGGGWIYKHTLSTDKECASNLITHIARRSLADLLLGLSSCCNYSENRLSKLASGLEHCPDDISKTHKDTPGRIQLFYLSPYGMLTRYQNNEGYSPSNHATIS